MKHFVFFRQVLILTLLFLLFDFLLSILLINGLNKYYGFSQNPNILINGSSMSMAGFNRNDLQLKTNKQIAIYAQEGVSVVERDAMIKHFFQMYPEGIKTVVYEVNPLIFSNIKTAENIHTHFYPFMDDKTIDSYIKGTAEFKDYYTHKIIRTLRFDSRLNRLILKGYLGKYDNIKSNTLDTASLKQLQAQKGNVEVIMEESNIEIFEHTMDFIRGNNCNIVLIMMPMYVTKLETFDRNGYEKLCKYFLDYSFTGKGISFLDLNKFELSTDASNYSDPLHFNINGQKRITDLMSLYLNE